METRKTLSQPLTEENISSGSGSQEADGQCIGKTTIDQSEPDGFVKQKLTVVKSETIIKGEDIYPLSSGSNRGNALIVNVREFSDKECTTRYGSEHDVENSKELWQQIGFNVEVAQNLNRLNLMNRIIRFAMMDHGDVIVLVLMSHGVPGGDRGKLICSDGQEIDICEDILKNFNNFSTNMLSKPKLVFIQGCRGDIKGHRVSVDANPFSMSEMSPPGAPPGSPRFTTEYGDMIISRSTIPGYVSFRNPDLGSWYIQYICEVFSKHAHNTPVQKMLQKVHEKMEESGVQCPEYTNIGFTKDLYLHPGMSLP